MDERKAHWHRKIKKLFLVFVLGYGVRVWTISDDNADYWRYYGFKDMVHVPFESPVPVDGDDAQKAVALRDAYLSGSKYLVITIARVVPEKGIDELIAAVENLRKRAIEARLIVVGEGQDAGHWEASAAVTFLGSKGRDELSPLLQSADVFALCSWGEPYGLAVREALQFGLPVVATEGVPSAKWLCDHGWNIVPVGDVPAIEAALGRALSEEKWEPQPPVDVNQFYVDELLSID